MMKEVAVAIVEPSDFDLPDTAHFVRLDLSGEAAETNARIPPSILTNRKDTLITVVGYQRRDPIAARRIERHFSAPEIRIPCMPPIKSLFLIGRRDCNLSGPDEVLTKFRWVELDGNIGVVLQPGVWHSTQCFPLDAESCRFLFMLDAEGEADFKRFSAAPFASSHNEVVDLVSPVSIIPNWKSR